MKLKLLPALLAGALLLAFAMPNRSAAQDKSLEERVAELEKKVEKLEKYIEKLEAEKKVGDAEALLRSVCDRVRIQYAKAGSYPRKPVADCGVTKDELSNDTHTVRDEVFFLLGSDNRSRRRERFAALVADPKDKGGRYAVLTFSWHAMDRTVKWYDSEQKLKEDNPEIKSAGAATETVDPFALYKKKGRKWTHKQTTKMQGMDDYVSYQSYEVTEVEANYAMFKQTIMDKDRKPVVDPAESRIDFNSYQADDPYENVPPKVLKQEKVKVEAGEFECDYTEQQGSKLWMSRKHPGLMVKLVGESFTMELVEYKD